MIEALISQINAETLKVHVPSKVVFLCGGAIDTDVPPTAPKMLRDVYYRHRRGYLSSLPFRLILAEDAQPFFADAGYNDLLSFEADIAQIVGLIVLFVESAGSFAELGAFSALPTIAPNLLAVMLDHYYEQQSFIKHGPITFLENRYGEEAVLSLDMSSLGIIDAHDVTPTNQDELVLSLERTIASRLDKIPKWQSFDVTSDGHKILVLTGLCQEYGALTQGEAKELLSILGIDISSSRLKNFLYCAELLNWIKVVRKGNHKYIIAMYGQGQDKALDWKFKDSAPYRDRLRWRATIRDNWRKSDSVRHRAISDVGGSL